MSREREVKVVVLGEDRGASKALKQVDDAAAKLGPSGKIAENALDGVSSKITSGLGPASGQAKEALDKVGASALSSGSLLTSALAGGAVVAGAALVAMAVDGIGKFVDLAGEVRNFGRATGLSAEDSSRMVSVLDDLGISSEVGGAAMFKLAKNVGDGGEKLAKYGVEVAKTKDGNLDLMGTLLNVADAYARTNDQGKRAELVMAAFGKAGQNLIPILEKGRDGIQEMLDAVKRGEILTEKQIADTRRFELAIDDVQDSFRSLQIQGASALLPYITSVTEAGTKTLDFIDTAGARGGGVKGMFENIATGILPAVGALQLFGLGNDDAGDKAKGAAAKFDLEVVALADLGVEVSDAEKATGELTAETKKAAAEAEKYKAKIEQMATAVGSAYTAMSGKSKELSEKVRDQARAYDTAKLSADQLKQGLDILVGVHLTATQAAINWEQKLKDTRTALSENGRTLDITTEAGRKNQSAIIDMINAGLGHVDALKREGASSEEVSRAYGDHVQALRNVMRQAGYTDDQINGLIDRYGLMRAQPDISKNINVYHNNYHRDYYETIKGMDPWVGSMHTGGIVPGTGDVPMLLQGGEGVFTPEQMAVLGASIGRGGDGADTPAGPGNVYVTIGTLVGSDGMRELTEIIRSEQLRYQRRVPTLGYT